MKHAPISSIYRHGPAIRTDAQEIRDRDEFRRRAWHELGLAVIDPADVADDWLRQAIRNEANRQFGQRKGR